MTAVKDLREGDMVDLSGDAYADAGPHPADKAKAGTATDYDSHRLAFECEYQVVFEVVRETPGTVCVYFDGFAVGFPSDHDLQVVKI